ncbi:MAG: sodium-dependent transporter [Bacteroidales bacterium]|nr:sodium-dependent transporter [Bacteroidales bacterium]
MSQQRTQFASKFGVIAAAVGSAVGLGNIWKFPYIVGQNGGGAFLIVYVVCVLLMGFLAIMTEMSVGRMSQASPLDAFRKLTGNNRWTFIGAMGFFSAFMILGFYLVVAGWSLEYLVQSVTTFSFNGMSTEQLEENFSVFSTASVRPYIWTVVFIVLNVVVISMGVQKGIEKCSEILMPILFLVILYLAVSAFFLPNSYAGYEFYLSPDFSKISPSVVLSALGQSFFSLSLGIGAILTYGSYIKEGNIVHTSWQICLLDTLIAFLAGLVIFPSVFAYGIEPGQGPSLAFIALPAVFSQMPGGIAFSILFFLLISIAALTSTISLFETCVASIVDHFNLKRGWTLAAISLLLLLTCSLCCASLNPALHLTVFGMTVFDFFDYLTSDILLPLGGLVMSIFLGWCFSKDKFHKALTEFGMPEWLFRIYMVFVRFIVPVVILLVMLQQLGLF